MRLENIIYLDQMVTKIFYKIIKIESKALKNEIDDKKINLTFNDVHILHEISKYKNPNYGLIAKVMEVTKGTFTTSIKRLLKNDFVVSKNNKEDKRKKNIYLTQKGKLINKIYLKFHFRMITYLSQGLSSEEQSLLYKAVGNLFKIFDKIELETKEKEKLIY